MEAGKRTISDIFNSNRVLQIPFFQRSYVWDTENWERFCDDMGYISEKNSEYFLGSIILKQQSTKSDDPIGDLRIVVDGQQRLTTLMLFFKSVCDIQDKKKDFTRQFMNRIEEIILEHNYNDIEIFNAIINDDLSAELEKKYANNQILNCYKFFKNKKALLKNMNYNNLINKIYFVGIDLGDSENEQQVFDTINSLGVSLTTAELLKNELFNRDDITLFNKTWKATFENDNKEYWEQEVTSGRRENIDLLLQTYLLLKSGAKDKYTYIESLFNNYKALIKEIIANTKNQENSKEKLEKNIRKNFIEGLVADAGLYKKNILPNLVGESINNKSHIERLNIIIFGLNTTTIIPYVIYLLKEINNDEVLEKIFKLLESYLIRRLICKETTKNYSSLFVSFIRNKINSYEALHDKIYRPDNQREIYPKNEALLTGIKESNLTNQQAKTILYLLEISIRDNQKEATGILGLNRYSLEHIMPKKWLNNWDDNLDEEMAQKRDQALLKLGNLTIITSSLNSSIRDSSWEIKKNGKNGKLGLKEYSQGIKIFSGEDFLESECWNEDKIDKRANFIYNHAASIWPY